MTADAHRDPCADAVADVARGKQALEKMLAEQHLEPINLRRFAEPYVLPMGGEAPSDAQLERQQRTRAPFVDKQTGDRVKIDGVSGIVIAGHDWSIVKRGTDIYFAIPKTFRVATCVDPSQSPTNCWIHRKPGGIAAVEIPKGMTFKGTLELDVEGVGLEVTGGECPSPPP